MDIKVTAQNTSCTSLGGSSYRYAIEASTLGLPPGHFPERILTDLGNGLPFYWVGMDRHNGELVAARYEHPSGLYFLDVLDD